jgi:competence protein ComFB
MEEKSPNNRPSDLTLVNITEELVRSKVKGVLKSMGACQCEMCCLDTCAIALNALPPKYVTTTRGSLLAEITTAQMDNQTSILVELTKAAMKVKENPRHAR